MRNVYGIIGLIINKSIQDFFSIEWQNQYNVEIEMVLGCFLKVFIESIEVKKKLILFQKILKLNQNHKLL